MNNEIMNILEDVCDGKIDGKKGAELIRNVRSKDITKKGSSSKIKIYVKDSEEGKTIKIPAIPFWLLTSLGNVGLKISSWAMKNSEDIDDDAKKIFSNLKDLDLKEIFDVLKNHEPCDIVNIVEEDGNEVIISIL